MRVKLYQKNTEVAQISEPHESGLIKGPSYWSGRYKRNEWQFALELPWRLFRVFVKGSWVDIPTANQLTGQVGTVNQWVFAAKTIKIEADLFYVRNVLPNGAVSTGFNGHSEECSLYYNGVATTIIGGKHEYANPALHVTTFDSWEDAFNRTFDFREFMKIKRVEVPDWYIHANTEWSVRNYFRENPNELCWQTGNADFWFDDLSEEGIP